MSISLKEMRTELLPGLSAIRYSRAPSPILVANPAVAVPPAMSFKHALSAVTAAIVVKNPEVSRRFWRR